MAGYSGKRSLFFPGVYATPPVPAFTSGSLLLKFLKRKAGQGCLGEAWFLSDAPQVCKDESAASGHGGLHKRHMPCRLLLPAFPSHTATANKWQIAPRWKKGNSKGCLGSKTMRPAGLNSSSPPPPTCGPAGKGLPRWLAWAQWLPPSSQPQHTLNDLSSLKTERKYLKRSSPFIAAHKPFQAPEGGLRGAIPTLWPCSAVVQAGGDGHVDVLWEPPLLTWGAGRFWSVGAGGDAESRRPEPPLPLLRPECFLAWTRHFWAHKYKRKWLFPFKQQPSLYLPFTKLLSIYKSLFA